MADERSYRFPDIDKMSWGEGAWIDEPDKVVWVDDATGLDCMIVRNHGGALCGYVGVPEGHAWHGKDYDSLDVEVHGGLTYDGPCQHGKDESEHAICHTSRDGVDNVWWLGFDTAHLMDLCPAYRRLGDVWHSGHHDIYRDLAYVTAEVTSLAKQASL